MRFTMFLVVFRPDVATPLAEEQTYNMNIPNGKIYKGTAFFITGIGSGGQVLFKNDMRSTTAETQFFRVNEENSLIAPPERHRIWINLERGDYVPNDATNPSPFRQALIGYTNGATDGATDRVFDAVSLADPDISIDVYSLAPASGSTDHLAIQGRWPFHASDYFKLGYRVFVDSGSTTSNLNDGPGHYTFTATGDGMFDGSPGSQRYYLRDMSATGGVYSFPHTIDVTSTVNNDMTRYRVVFTTCSANITAFNSLIYTTATSGATQYEWFVTNQETNQTAHFYTSNNYMSLQNILNSTVSPSPTAATPFLSYGTTYTYYAIPNANAPTEPEFCEVTTPVPVPTSVHPSQCNGTINICLPVTIYNNPPNNALYRDYNVTITGPDGIPHTYTIPYNPSAITMPNLAGLPLAYGATYTIQVQIQNPGGSPLALGPICTVTTAAPVVSLANCSTTLTTFCAQPIPIAVTNTPNCLGRSYHVRVTGPDNIPHEFDIPANPGNFYLETAAYGISLAYATTYNVEVRVNNPGGPTLGYGSVCQVTTPSPEAAIAGYTSVTPVNVASTCPWLSTVMLPGKNNCLGRSYNVRVTDSGNNSYIISNLNANPGTVPLTGLAYSGEYKLEVQVQNPGGPTLPFGPICTIKAPSFPISQLTSDFCGAAITTSSIYIRATEAANPCGYQLRYRFRMTNIAGNPAYNQEWQNPSLGMRQFQLQSFTGWAFSTVYNVQVIPVINGVPGDWDDAVVCTITTPPPPRLRATFEVAATPNPFDAGFGFDISSPETSPVEFQVYDMLGRLVESRKSLYSEIENQRFGEHYAAGIYNVIISQGDNKKTVRVVKK